MRAMQCSQRLQRENYQHVQNSGQHRAEHARALGTAPNEA